MCKVIYLGNLAPKRHVRQKQALPPSPNMDLVRSFQISERPKSERAEIEQFRRSSLMFADFRLTLEIKGFGRRRFSQITPPCPTYQL